MRILFSATPAHGHVLPLLPLERAARHAGHHTVVLTHGSLAGLVAPTPVLNTGPTLPELLEEVRRRTGTDATQDMSPAVVGEFFGGARLDMAADSALAAAEAFAPELIVAESSDFIGPLVAASMGVPWVSHGVGIAIEPVLVEAMRTAAAQRMRARGIDPSPPIATVDPWPDCLHRDQWEPPHDRIAIRPRHTTAKTSVTGRCRAFPVAITFPGFW